jgi:predicted XRE-type DNA-binding protein
MPRTVNATWHITRGVAHLFTGENPPADQPEAYAPERVAALCDVPAPFNNWDSGNDPYRSMISASADLLTQIEHFISKKGSTQTQAPQHCGISQPRVHELMSGQINKFSLDALVNIVTALGRRVQTKIAA